MHCGSGASTLELWKARAGRGSDPGSLVKHTLETQPINQSCCGCGVYRFWPSTPAVIIFETLGKQGS